MLGTNLHPWYAIFQVSTFRFKLFSQWGRVEKLSFSGSPEKGTLEPDLLECEDFIAATLLEENTMNSGRFLQLLILKAYWHLC